jgi:hypothetical protein
MESPRDSEFRDENVDPYEPSILDVLVVKAMLNKALALPPELLNTIIDLAEYWPHSSTELSGGLPIFGGRGGREDVFLVRTTFKALCTGLQHTTRCANRPDSYDQNRSGLPKHPKTPASTTRPHRYHPGRCGDGTISRPSRKLSTPPSLSSRTPAGR